MCRGGLRAAASHRTEVLAHGGGGAGHRLQRRRNGARGQRQCAGEECQHGLRLGDCLFRETRISDLLPPPHLGPWVCRPCGRPCGFSNCVVRLFNPLRYGGQAEARGAARDVSDSKPKSARGGAHRGQGSPCHRTMLAKQKAADDFKSGSQQTRQLLGTPARRTSTEGRPSSLCLGELYIISLLLSPLLDLGAPGASVPLKVESDN